MKTKRCREPRQRKTGSSW